MILENRYCFRILATLFAGLLLASMPLTQAQAAPANPQPVATPPTGSGQIAPQTCDTQVWQTMEMRAKMETSREIMQNQNLIFKPDSILAYTCFDSFAAHAAAYVGPLFTHTQYWGELIIGWGSRDPGLDHALQTAVTQSMQTYIQGGFNHSLLGGRGSLLNPALPMHTVTQVPSQGGDYNCQIMSQVWRAAKCMNFIHNGSFEEDGFFPFKDLQAVNGEAIQGYQSIGEPRQFPANLACTAGNVVWDQGGTIPWETATDTSQNRNPAGEINLLYAYQDPNSDTFTSVQERLDPGVCDQPAIMTGVTVVPAPGEDTWEDGVCTNPGCTFTRNGNCEGGSGAGAAPRRPRIATPGMGGGFAE